MNDHQTPAPASAADRQIESGRGRGPGHVVPVIDRNRCEAKAGCVAVCPHDVFEIRPLEPADRAGLSLRGRIKAWAHGNRQAYVAKPDACHACGLCIAACPEDAIHLLSVAAPRR